MTTADGAEVEALFREHFLWPDDEWLELKGEGFSYWPARTAQRFRSRSSSICHAKRWEWAMPLVAGVTKTDLAAWLCVRLNEYSCGWSFYFDRDEATVVAIASVWVFGDRDLIRFGQGARVAGWFCEAILDQLAAATGGVPLVSFPSSQQAPREMPDTAGYIATAMRERPEWVVDWTGFRFPTVETLVLEIEENVEPDGVLQVLDDDRLHLWRSREGCDFQMIAGFGSHPVLGAAWRTDLIVPLADQLMHPAAVEAATRFMFGCDLTGAWVSTEYGLVFRSWATSAELHVG